MLEYQTVEVNGLPTTYLEAGSTSSPTVLLLHDGGFGSDARSCWEPLIPLLAEHYHVVAPDLLGHGGSPKAFFFDRDPMTQRLWHTTGFVAALGLRDVAYVGSSFGGGMVLQGCTRGVLSMRAGVSIAGPGGIFMTPAMFALQNYEPSLEAARAIAEKLMLDPSEDEVKRRYEATLQPGHWEALAAARMRNPALTDEGPDWRPQYQERLRTVQTPILLVAGDQDDLVEEDWEKRIADLLPNGSSVEIAPARHQPHIDHPEEVADVLVKFLTPHLEG